jgi:hypothetical protein
MQDIARKQHRLDEPGDEPTLESSPRCVSRSPALGIRRAVQKMRKNNFVSNLGAGSLLSGSSRAMFGQSRLSNPVILKVQFELHMS